MPEPSRPKKLHVRAVPWNTPTEDQVKGALGEVPAYVRRARRLEDAMRDLRRDAENAREEMLLFVALRLGRHLDVLEALTLARSVEVEEIHATVRDIEAFRNRRPRRVKPAGEPARSLGALGESVGRFNARWAKWVEEDAPLDRVNREVEGYNLHYRLERQCAVKYVPFERLKFEKKAPVTVEDLLREFPPLPLPA